MRPEEKRLIEEKLAQLKKELAKPQRDSVKKVETREAPAELSETFYVFDGVPLLISLLLSLILLGSVWALHSFYPHLWERLLELF
ncbi:hypothetical protein J7L13_01990 [bacterium]|nr:hypothetical protein [bacterium]